MRILTAEPALFVASQLRFIRFLLRYWWTLLVLCGFLFWHGFRVLPPLPLYLSGIILVGAGSYGLLLRLDLRANTASLAFGLLIMFALWPLRLLSGAYLLGENWQLLLTVQYLAGIFLVWGLAVPLTRTALNGLISKKTEFLQYGESKPYQPRELKPTLDFSRLRRYRDRQESQ